MVEIAGHNFSIGPLGNRCSNSKKLEDGTEIFCNRNLVDILGTTCEDVGKPNIACVGNLTETEYKQIEAERDRIWGHMRHPA